MGSPDKNLSAIQCQLSCLPENIFEEDIEYEMKYTSGTSMWDFWLSEVSLSKSLEWWKGRITAKVLSYELKEVSTINANCLVVVLLPSGVAIRAKVLDEPVKDEFGNFYPFLLDIDTGEIMRVHVNALYVPDEDIMGKKPFAVNCCLSNGKNYNNRMFLQNISADNLKVTFKRVTLSNPPKYVVRVRLKRKDTYIDIVNSLNHDRKSQETNPTVRNRTDVPAGEVIRFERFSNGIKIENKDGTKVIMDVQVSHLDSISRFYIWESIDHLKHLNNLVAEMKAYYKSKFVDESDTFYERLSPGIACAALDLKDLSWYRAQVLNHSKTTNFKGLVQKHYEVLFVDFGSRIEVPCSFLRPLAPEFLKEPAFAKCCHLFGVKPEPSLESPDGLDYSQHVIEIFGLFLESGKLTLIEAPTSANDPPGSIPVILERNSKGNDYVINLELLAQKLVTSSVLDVQTCNQVFECAENENIGSSSCAEISEIITDKSEVSVEEKKIPEEEILDDEVAPILSEPSVSNDAFADWNPMREDYESNEISYENVVNDDASALIGYQATDESRICKFFAESGRCFKGASCKKEHTYIRPDGITTDCQLVPGKAYSYLSLPRPGSEIKLHVMFVCGVCRFYAVLVDAWKYKETACEFLPNEKFKDDTLENLIDFINSKENISKLKRLVMPPGVGELVMCKIKSTDTYHRAQVLDTNLEDNEFEVLFVDIGMTDWVNARYIRQIENEYLHLPFQAVECELAYCGVSPETDGYRKIEITRKLSSVISFKVLTARIIQSLTPINKLIVELFDDSGTNIGEELKQSGYFIELRDAFEHCLGPLPG
ncbi:uncharacterized protein [Hetaerina americana]|uniref:uncharacterized protein n=1 Tax=Hetaerina americana TaxID=62018 RepID=UPI003A7F3806